jgi:N-acetyl-alpha-D-glucosaminyl L-malate synthase BshA
LKIAIVCYPTYGGSGVVATELGIALSKRGHEVHFVTYKHPVRLEALNKNLFYHEVYVPDYPLFQYQPYELALSSRLVEVVMDYQIDILHVHYAIPHAYAAYMAKKMIADHGVNLPIVTTLHGTDITLVGRHPFYKEAVTFSINHSDRVTAVSNSLREDTLRLFDLKREIEVIPNFIDWKKYAHKEQPCNRTLLAQKEEKIITHISNFRPLKRVLDVLHVFERIQSKIPAKLMMVGEGPEKAIAQRYCEENQLESRVAFLGKSDEIDKILCYSDLFLLPSEQESFGLVALEAMVHKVPVISTNVGGLPEVNKQNISGFLFPVGAVDAMAEQAISLLSNTQEHLKIKEQAFMQAKKFDIFNVIPQYEAVYQSVLIDA